MSRQAAAACQSGRRATKLVPNPSLAETFGSFNLRSSPVFQFKGTPYRLALLCFVVSICRVCVSKWSQSNSSGKTWVQRVGSRRLGNHCKTIVFPARSSVGQVQQFYPRGARSSLHATISNSESECTSAKLGNCRGLESPPERTTGFQSIGTGRKRRGIPHRSRRRAQHQYFRSPGTESRSPRFSRRRHFAALARVGSGGGIDPEGIGICAPGTPSPHLYEGSSRERVCTRDAKPSCLGDGGGETARGFPDPWKQDAA